MTMMDAQVSWYGTAPDHAVVQAATFADQLRLELVGHSVGVEASVLLDAGVLPELTRLAEGEILQRAAEVVWPQRAQRAGGTREIDIRLAPWDGRYVVLRVYSDADASVELEIAFLFSAVACATAEL